MASSASNTEAEKADEEAIVLPKLKYGYRTVPLEWPELVQIIQVEQDLAKLSRSVEQQTSYAIYMRDLKRKWSSVYHFILHSKFGFAKRQVAGTGNNEGALVWESYPPVSDIKEPQKALVENDFPYYNAPGIQHYILWKIGGDVTDQEIEEAGQDLRAKLGDVCGVVHWKNPPHLKSLPDIDHVHILVHRQTTSTSGSDPSD
ncbi:expressed unknown protein [Seminavis robusta]|uniref:Uncharacterized protein n=1 Tax=Seminavis robusta TaxID=568900 RepID=A0A9N8ER14_9STRA|nr:expressed unknown protein [Seminavis robusta]|eukprot:Sro1835_g300600.1 n/a (202) ;mRNA; f:14724-15329